MHSFTRLAVVTMMSTVLCSGSAMAQAATDSATADPSRHEVVFENEQVRVVRWTIPVGEKTLLHSHPDGVLILVNDYHARVTTPDGRTEEVNLKARSAVWRPATAHVEENLGNQPLRGVLVEPRQPSSALPAGFPDDVTADPKHAKVLFENALIRVIYEEYVAAATAPTHAHPDSVIVALTDMDGRYSNRDSHIAPGKTRAGDARWCPATVQGGQNGSQALAQIVVEMKRSPLRTQTAARQSEAPRQ